MNTLNLIQSKGLKLRQVQFAIRHGDRSAIHTLPGADIVHWTCSPYSKRIEVGVYMSVQVHAESESHKAFQSHDLCINSDHGT